MKHTINSLVAVMGLLCLGASSGWAQSDVTQPGDPLIASSPNNPGSEGVANAIDNQPTKYLNFDAGDGIPVGFIVSPQVGLTQITGVSLQSANDAPERDPLHITIEGSNDPSALGWDQGNWELIYENAAIPSWVTTFPGDDRFQTQTFSFANLMPYLHYRFTVVEVQDVNAANSFQIAEVELLGRVVPGDVTQPGDALIASSPNNPGSEGVANAIDNQPTKYLNFDAGDGIPVGFIVTPSIGQTLVTGISLQSANDAPERDPLHITIEGSNDPDATAWDQGNWEPIYENMAIPSWVTTFPGDDRFQVQTFLFPNFMPYLHYRFTVVEVQDVNAANSFQIAEVELLGTGAPKDVTQPGDALIASSPNNPGSEGVANAIDNQPTKYLNFDAGDGIPVGFIVTPSAGDSTVIGLTLQSANDAPERDPLHVTLEGSNDEEVTAWDAGSWELIYENVAIPSWVDTFPGDDRFQVQAFYFENTRTFRHYRFTVVEVQDVDAANSFQIAEVELLAVTDQVDCEKAAFLTLPVDTPVLEGEPATFFTVVNGPWPVQWYKNGERIPGATDLLYTTEPITQENAADLYSVEIVGCQLSPEVQAVIFTPSDVKSIGVNFRGGGANGAPTDVLATDVAGIHLQAYWNNMTNATDAAPPALLDSDGNTASVTVEFASSGNWGAGTGDLSPNQRLLSGLVHTGNAAGNRATNIFHNVPAGEHSVIAYTVGIPLQFQDQDYFILDAAGNVVQEVYTTAINADQYNPNPIWIRGTSQNPSFRTLANYVRFDKVQPDANGDIVFVWANQTDGYDRGTALNAIQLLLDPPDSGVPPSVTAAPEPVETLDGGTVTLQVQATGTDLVYQWRRNGANIFDGGDISGTGTDTLTIRRFSAGDEGFYSVAIINPAGGVVTQGIKVKVVDGNRTISDTLTTHYKFDETGTAIEAVNSGLDEWPLLTEGPSWVPGIINNAIDLGITTGFAEDFTKIDEEVTVSAWVYLDPLSLIGDQNIVIVRNADGALQTSAPLGQFDFGLVRAGDGSFFNLRAALAVGPNIATVRETVAFPLEEWQHVAFTADGGQLRLYRNGQLAGVTAYLDNVNQPDTPWLSVGARLVTDPLDPNNVVPEDGNAQYLTGYVDDLAIWQFAWGQSVIQSIYDQGQAGSDVTTATLPELPPVPTDIEMVVSMEAGQITIGWAPDEGVLESNGNLSDPASWAPVANQANPYVIPTPTGTQFFRVVDPQQ